MSFYIFMFCFYKQLFALFILVNSQTRMNKARDKAGCAASFTKERDVLRQSGQDVVDNYNKSTFKPSYILEAGVQKSLLQFLVFKFGDLYG